MKNEGGYILLTLLLLASVLAFSLAVILPDTVFEIKRDREQEMVHRGVQYSRALGAYYKKFGRYPARIEDLESTSNLRFLRRRYKDPESKNQDFKLLHYGEVKMSLGGGIAGASLAGINPAGTPGGLNAATVGAALNGLGAIAQQTGFGAATSNPFASNSSATPSSTTASTPGSDSSQNGSANGQVSAQGATDASSSQQQAFGGLPVIGVTSNNSKDATIREYNHKRKYNEWQFIYDPSGDRGGLITTPYQPTIGFSAANQPGQNGQPGQPGAASPFASSPFGQNSNSNSGMNSSSPATPQQPATPPQQQ